MKNSEFLKGVKDGFPICLGYLSVAFAFGIFAVAKGLNCGEALLISMTNVTSAGQLAAVPCIAGGGTLLELAVSQLVINSRYALMSVSLSQKLDGSVRLFDRFIIAFVNTDEVFAVATNKKENVGKAYMYGLILTPYLGWSAGTILGAVAGDILPKAVISALSVAIYGMFIAIVVPEIKTSKPTAICAAIACVLSILFCFVPFLKVVPQGFVIIICACVAAGVAAILFPINTQGEMLDEI